MGAGFTFPPSPTPGETVVGANGAVYRWTNGRWVGVGGGTPVFPLSIAQGGTAAADAASARVNLGLTLPLAVASGGTGSADANAARAALGILSMAAAVAPIMLGSANGIACLTGNGPDLVRVGNMVFCSYQGANKNTVTANTVSLFWIPDGFKPTATVAMAIATPAVTITISVIGTGTSVFADVPATNNLTSGRYVARTGTQFAANAAVSLSMSWRTADAVPTS